jgi:hypothetical protein
MEMLILLLLASIGMTNILLYGDIFEKPRLWWYTWLPQFWHKLIECHMCMGFWTGMVVAAMMMAAHMIPFAWLAMFLYGCAASFVNVLSTHVQTWFEANSNFDLGDNKDG